jgi:hypothetical protein
MKRLKILIALMLLGSYCENKQIECYKPIELKIIVEK